MPLTVRVSEPVEIVPMELRELEITPPRRDFTPVVERAVAEAKAGRHPGTAAARELYRTIGVDPTRTRPSSEALLRRVSRGNAFPRINSLVDVANVMSLLSQTPIGLYDLAATVGEGVAVRRGQPGEGYEGIGKGWVNVAGRLCVSDSVGPVGNPTSDSARTMITTDTEHALWIWFLPVGEPYLDRAAELIARFGRGLVTVVAPE